LKLRRVGVKREWHIVIHNLFANTSLNITLTPHPVWWH
jgi:hypothetical protein